MKKAIKSAHPFAKPYEDLETGKHQGKMWRGVPGVEMIWHGEWSDPELEYEGERRNYWDVEDAMYECAKEDGIDTENDEEFNRYCQEHAYDVYECFSSCGKKKGKKKPVKSARRPIQSMYVTEDISGNDLYTRLWSGGKDQFNSMIEDGADADDILDVCEQLLFTEEGNPPTITDLNDLIWFEPDTIREMLGLGGEIESGCNKKSKKGKKKPVKSAKRPIKNNFVEKHGIYHNDTWKLEVVELEGNTAILKPVKSDDYFVVKNPEIDEQGDLVWTSDSLPMTDYDTALKEFNYYKDLNNASPTFNSRKPIKSSYFNPYNGEGEFLASIEVVQEGEHDTVSFSSNVMPLTDFLQECKGYAESTNGYYIVTENGENQYKFTFETSDDSFADEPGTDPYYTENCGVVIVELIYPFDRQMAEYMEDPF